MSIYSIEITKEKLKADSTGLVTEIYNLLASKSYYPLYKNAIKKVLWSAAKKNQCLYTALQNRIDKHTLQVYRILYRAKFKPQQIGLVIEQDNLLIIESSEHATLRIKTSNVEASIASYESSNVCTINRTSGIIYTRLDICSIASKHIG
jgi:hypothetical protein